MPAQPDSTLNKLIERLSGYAKDHTKLSEFTVRHLKNEANILMKVNPAEGAMIKGMIACLEGDLEECEKQHEISIKLNHDLIFVQNYASSLSRLGKNKYAYQLIKQVLKDNKNSAEVIYICIQIAFYAGCYSDISNYQDMLKRLKINDIPDETVRYISYANVMTNMNFPDNVFPQISSILESIRLDHHVETKQSYLFSIEDGIFHWEETTADVDTTVTMNIELAEELAIREDLKLDGYTIAFRAHQ